MSREAILFATDLARFDYPKRGDGVLVRPATGVKLANGRHAGTCRTQNLRTPTAGRPNRSGGSPARFR